MTDVIAVQSASTQACGELDSALTDQEVMVQAAVTRLRALNAGLETMAHGTDMPIRHRIKMLLEALIPCFADSLVCYLPGETDRLVQAGDISYAGHVLQTVVLAPNREPGRLVAKRVTAFAAEDSAILQSAANAISLLLYSS